MRESLAFQRSIQQLNNFVEEELAHIRNGTPRGFHKTDAQGNVTFDEQWRIIFYDEELPLA